MPILEDMKCKFNNVKPELQGQNYKAELHDVFSGIQKVNGDVTKMLQMLMGTNRQIVRN